MEKETRFPSSFVAFLGFIIAGLLIAQTIFAGSGPITSSVTVGNAIPSVTAVAFNNGSAITLTANATTSISVNATITDNNGCADLAAGTTSILLYRNGVTSSTCLGAPSNLNCYTASAFTATSTCSTTNINTTTTFGVYYFANSAGVTSSSFPTDSWRATVRFTNPGGATSSADSATTSLNILTAINITTSSINYGTLAASSTTQGTNQTTTLANAGNSSTTLNLSGTALVSGANSVTSTYQHYATSSFTYGTGDQQLQSTPTAVSGFTLTTPTSTTNVQGTIFWGTSVPAGTPTGTFNGTTTFASVFSS